MGRKIFCEKTLFSLMGKKEPGIERVRGKSEGKIKKIIILGDFIVLDYNIIYNYIFANIIVKI